MTNKTCKPGVKSSISTICHMHRVFGYFNHVGNYNILYNKLEWEYYRKQKSKKYRILQQKPHHTTNQQHAKPENSFFIIILIVIHFLDTLFGLWFSAFLSLSMVLELNEGCISNPTHNNSKKDYGIEYTKYCVNLPIARYPTHFKQRFIID